MKEQQKQFILWDGRDHPNFWKGDTWTCPNCEEVYPGAKRGIAEPCIGNTVAYVRDNWPPHTRHHWPSHATPLALWDAREPQECLVLV